MICETAGLLTYLAQSRDAWAEVISEPEQFIPAGNRIVVFVHARARPKNGTSGRRYDSRTSTPSVTAKRSRCEHFLIGRRLCAGLMPGCRVT